MMQTPAITCPRWLVLVVCPGSIILYPSMWNSSYPVLQVSCRHIAFQLCVFIWWMSDCSFVSSSIGSPRTFWVMHIRLLLGSFCRLCD